jgi:hypothetical protein
MHREIYKLLKYKNYKLFDRHNDMYKSGLNHIKIKKYNSDVCLIVFGATAPPPPNPHLGQVLLIS